MKTKPSTRSESAARGTGKVSKAQVPSEKAPSPPTVSKQPPKPASPQKVVREENVAKKGSVREPLSGTTEDEYESAEEEEEKVKAKRAPTSKVPVSRKGKVTKAPNKAQKVSSGPQSKVKAVLDNSSKKDKSEDEEELVLSTEEEDEVSLILLSGYGNPFCCYHNLISCYITHTYKNSRLS